MLVIKQNEISCLQRQRYVSKIPYASGDDGGQKMKTGKNGKMSLFYFLIQMEVNPSCIGHSVVGIICGENVPSAYTWQIH